MPMALPAPSSYCRFKALDLRNLASGTLPSRLCHAGVTHSDISNIPSYWLTTLRFAPPTGSIVPHGASWPLILKAHTMHSFLSKGASRHAK